MRLLVVDDETPARSRLVRIAGGLPDCEVVGEAANGIDALEAVGRLTPDVVLLDVRMPRMDGIEVARHLAELTTPPAVIFATAYDEYALAAFDAHAVAYLLKPVRAEKLAEALEHARQPNRAQLGTAAAPRRHISARVRERLELVPVETVRCFVADQKYVIAKHDNGELLITDTLKELEREFTARFIRIHRNALVALDYIEHLDTTDGDARIRLRGGDAPLEVSRRHLAAVRKRLRR